MLLWKRLTKLLWQQDGLVESIKELQAKNNEQSAELKRIYLLPELEWAQVCATVMQIFAMCAKSGDQKLAQKMAESLDKGKVYVGRLRSKIIRLEEQVKNLEATSCRPCGVLAARLNKVEEERDDAIEAIRQVIDCPYVLEEATIPKAGINAAPNQVVGTLHVALVRMRKIRELIGDFDNAKKT